MKEEHNTLKQLLQKAIPYWYIFAIAFPLCLVLSYLYLLKAQSVYQATATLLIKTKGNQPNSEFVFSEFGGLVSKNKNLEDEVFVLKSTPLMHVVVEDLELQYQYTATGSLKKKDLYKITPIEVLDWKPNIENEGLVATFYKDSLESYQLTVEEESFTGTFGKELQLPSGRLTLLRSGDGEMYDEIQLRISSVWNRAKELADKFEVEVLGESSNVLSLSLKDINPYRAQEILGKLIEVYNQKTITDKNRVFENTIKFIDDRLKLIAVELSETELDVEYYKRKFNVVELSDEGNMIMNELSVSKRQMSDSEVQLEILNSMHEFLLKNQNTFEFVPTNLSLTNLTLTRQLEKFNQLLEKRDQLSNEIGVSHPDFKLVVEQLRNFRQTIINNIQAIKQDLQVELRANQGLLSGLENRLQSLPKRERELINIERRKTIKENLYIYLLKTREEAAISRDVTAATGQIVEPPSFSDPVSPKRAQIWVIAAFFGLAFPAGLVLLLVSLNDDIQSSEDITSTTSVPLAGVIVQDWGKDKVVVKENSLNQSVELFRLLRSNIDHINGTSNVQSLLVTSSMHGEGKSYIATNLGLAQTLTGRKVVIVEINMRSQEKEKYTLKEPAKNGLIDYLVNPIMTIDHIIQNSSVHPLLDVINRGNPVGNPSKMIYSLRLRELIAQLKERYEFIILEAPSLDMMADTIEMKDLADATMIVVREGVTKKDSIEMFDHISKNDILVKPFIVLNGVSLNKLKYHGLLQSKLNPINKPQTNGVDVSYKHIS